MVDEIQRRREAFIRWQQANGLTVAAIYRASGVPESTIRSYIKGKADSLKGTTQALIAAAYGVSTADLFGDNQSVSRLGVFGRIGAKGDVFSVDRDGDAPMYDVDLSPAPGAPEDFVGFEIIDERDRHLRGEAGSDLPPSETPQGLQRSRAIQRMTENEPKGGYQRHTPPLTSNAASG